MEPRKLYNISALSAEFGLDRRTTLKRMAAVPPDGTVRRAAAWYLRNAAAALLGDTTNGANPSNGIAQRAGGPFSASKNPIDEAICTVLVMLAARIPIEMADVAKLAGAAPEMVAEIYKGSAVRICGVVNEVSEQIGITWANERHFDLPLKPDFLLASKAR